MFRALLVAVVLWSAAQNICVDRPSRHVVIWEGHFAFSGSKDKNKYIVIRECRPVKNKQRNYDREAFCKASEKITNRPDFCYTVKHRTRSRCENVIAQNVRYYFDHGEVVFIYPEEYLTGEQNNE